MSSVKEIERALTCCAELIEQYGDKYLPIFELLEQQLEDARARESTMDRVRQRLRLVHKMGTNW